MHAGKILRIPPRNALFLRGILGTAVLTLIVNPRPGHGFWLIIGRHSNGSSL